MIAQELQPIRGTRNPLTLDMIRRAAPSAFAAEAHSAMSGRYAYIPTVDVIEGMMKAGFMPFAASQSRARLADKREHTKHMIRFRQTSNAQIALNDVYPEVVLINSHDGTSAYKLMAGLFRLVCLNGAVVADSMIASISVRHSGNVIESAARGAAAIIERMPLVLNAVNDWSVIDLTKTEQGYFAEAAREIRFADADGNVDASITAEKLLAPKREADNKSDLWTVYNRVQENVMKGGIKTYDAQSQRKNKTRAVKSIDQDVRLNKALWTLAEKMAELKKIA